MARITPEERSYRTSLFAHQPEDQYEEKVVGDKVYVKHWNGNTERWQVAAYTRQSFANYKQGYQHHQDLIDLDNDLQMRLTED